MQLLKFETATHGCVGMAHNLSPNLCFRVEVLYTLNSITTNNVPNNCHVTQTKLKISPQLWL
jgi:hypothetical protein